MKARCGWRDTPDPAGVNVNVQAIDPEDTVKAAKERANQRRKLLKLLTPRELDIYLRLMKVAAERQAQQDAAEAKPAQVPARIETTAQPVPERQEGEGANSPKVMPVPGGGFIVAK